MTKVASLIFDLDGTLIDSSHDIAGSLNHTLKTLGLPVKSKNEVQGLVGDGVRALLIKATGRSDEEYLEKAIALFKPHYLEHCNDTTILYPGVAQILDHFKDKKKAVVSNKPHDMIQKTLRHFGIDGCFEVVLGGESTAQRKPHPEPVLLSLREMKVSPGDSVMVGDGSTDIQAGKSAGTRTCAVTYGYRDRAELERYKPDFFIDKIEDLKHIVF